MDFELTNWIDDPGRKRIICHRSCKYPNTEIDSTKRDILVKFCRTAAGNTIPPYIIYKAEYLWTTWTENGPFGSKYKRSKNG